MIKVKIQIKKNWLLINLWLIANKRIMNLVCLYSIVSRQGCNYKNINYLLIKDKMSSVKVSNFDIPNQSKRFSMAKYSEFDPQNVIQRNN